MKKTGLITLAGILFLSWISSVFANPSIDLQNDSLHVITKSMVLSYINRYEGYHFNQAISLGDQQIFFDALDRVDVRHSSSKQSFNAEFEYYQVDAITMQPRITICMTNNIRDASNYNKVSLQETMWHENIHVIEYLNADHMNPNAGDPLYDERNVEYMQYIAGTALAPLTKLEKVAEEGATNEELKKWWDLMVNRVEVNALQIPEARKYPPDLSRMRGWFGFSVRPSEILSYYAEGKATPRLKEFADFLMKDKEEKPSDTLTDSATIRHGSWTFDYTMKGLDIKDVNITNKDLKMGDRTIKQQFITFDVYPILPTGGAGISGAATLNSHNYGRFRITDQWRSSHQQCAHTFSSSGETHLFDTFLRVPSKSSERDMISTRIYMYDGVDHELTIIINMYQWKERESQEEEEYSEMPPDPVLDDTRPEINYPGQWSYPNIPGHDYENHVPPALFENRRIKIQINNPNATINGVPIEMDAPPVIRNGRTFVPLRFVSEALGAQVDYIPDLDGYQTVILSGAQEKRIDYVLLFIQSRKVYHNENVKELEAPPFIEGDRSFVPIRIISESFDADVEWNGSTQTITIQK